MTANSEGGYVPGSGWVSVKGVGPCANGHPLYLIDGIVQHVIASAAIRSGDTAEVLACQKALEEEQAAEVER